MRYKITIKKKDGALLIRETTDPKVVKALYEYAVSKGDTVVKVEQKEHPKGQYMESSLKSLGQLAVAGVGLGIGLSLLGSFGGSN